MANPNTLTLARVLDTIRISPPDTLATAFNQMIPPSKVPTEYMNSLSEQDRVTAHRACLLTWFLTSGTQVPRDIQLQSCLATFNGKDSLIYAGTGSGKTLPIALNILLEDPAKERITLTISPLKRLQITQVYTLLSFSDIPSSCFSGTTGK